MRWLAILAVPFFWSGCGHDEDGAPIRASLADGQILSGDLTTKVLVLQTSVGTLQIPLADVGEVVPTEASQLGAADGKVTVWLRDGSEFVGTWADPEMLVSIDVGGSKVDVDLPMDRLARLQTRAGELWPEGTAYRVRTIFGDDFNVDPEHTRLVMENDLGTFAPFLSECASARPVGDADGDWRIELTNGTVLVGPRSDDAITFALANGPEEITVPLTSFSRMERVWYAEHRAKNDHQPPLDLRDGIFGGEGQAASPTTPAPAPRSPAGWFENDRLREVKEQQVAH